MSKGSTTWNYTYDANGMRTQRSNGTTVYNYVYNGSQLTQMTVGSNTLKFAYDASGKPMMLTYNGTNYYYITNLQGDVMGIVDSTGTIVVNYTYDAWGRPLSVTGTMASTLGVQNPLRYRGYVYDVEIGLYYVSSRYYNPIWGRFLNADILISTGQGMLGNNMFAYCLNNPVCRKDVLGTISVEIFDSNGNNIPDEKEYGGHGGTGANGVYGGNGSPGGNGGHVGNSGSGGSSGSGPSSPISSSNAGANCQTGYGKAPPQAPPGTVYTQISSDGNNTVVSRTLYNEYSMPEFRIDYGGHTHGEISGVHMHQFSVYVGPNGIFLNKGPVVQCMI